MVRGGPIVPPAAAAAATVLLADIADTGAGEATELFGPGGRVGIGRFICGEFE